MINSIILGILVIMIFYDFTLHLIETLELEKFFYPRRNIFSYYWPVAKSRQVYNIGWTIYWGTAFLLIIIYVLL